MDAAARRARGPRGPQWDGALNVFMNVLAESNGTMTIVDRWSKPGDPVARREPVVTPAETRETS
jgi:uncharacterized protein YcgI (DUF1989 family)